MATCTDVDKYTALEELMMTNWPEFLLFIEKVSATQLDYKTILMFLESENIDVRDGARLLLDKVPGTFLDYQTLIGFLYSRGDNVGDGARVLLLKHFAARLDFETLIGFEDSNDMNVRNSTRVLLSDGRWNNCGAILPYPSDELAALFAKS